MEKNKSVIAIDPGYDRVGIAVFSAGGALTHSECFTPQTKVFAERLLAIQKRVRELVHEFSPSAFALETLFFSVNQKTALKVAEARGALLVTAAELELAIYEYSPQEIKIAVTGSGNADKKAVAGMVSRLAAIETHGKMDDELDAIALGMAHQAGFLLSTHIAAGR